MTTFIENVLEAISKKKLKLHQLTFILPNKRAGVYLQHHLKKHISKPIFAPQILSIEQFTEQLSGLRKLGTTELLFKFYSVYKQLSPKEKTDSFEYFTSWAPILLEDFNEIDLQLVDESKILNYLGAIKEMNHWSLHKEQTEFVKKHLAFWANLTPYYNTLKSELLVHNTGYKGLLYRQAVENLEYYIDNNSGQKHVFLGFNALSKSESIIIQELLQQDMAEIFWDIDEVFIKNPLHNSGFFIRNYKKQWNHYKNALFNWTTKHYSSDKSINIIGVPKQVGQAKYIANVLKKIYENKTAPNNIAVVLGNENTLMPLLNSLPKNVESVNITMGVALNQFPIATFFEKLFLIHKKNKATFYYRDVIELITHPVLFGLLTRNSINTVNDILSYININNIVHLSANQIKDKAHNHNTLIETLFEDWQTGVDQVLNKCLNLIFTIKRHLDQDKTNNKLELECLYRFYRLFNQLVHFNTNYNHIDNIATLHRVYEELLKVEKLNFRGEPLEGLQIMGVLESRVLDFETIIISNVNEGILPPGKTTNSFIPFDVKLENKLTTYREKDAIYTYHFFRLLQRAKNVYILYNTEMDGLNGNEKSRFITQIETEGIHNFKHKIITAKVPVINKSLEIIKKDTNIIKQIQAVAKKGFSPSSLNNYIRNPIDFYYEKILGVKMHDEVEETVAAQTLGTVIHNTLETLYQPLIGQTLSVKIIENMKPLIDKIVWSQFKKIYKKGNLTKGKNLIILEITKQYIINFLNLEIELIKSKNTITILGIESELKVKLPISELNYPIYITGTVDRIDLYNGKTRIIDYKTGKVEQKNVSVKGWENLTSNYDKYGKAFQILMYTYLRYKKSDIALPAQAGIYSFKNLNSGFLNFGITENEKNKITYNITEDTLLHFENKLKHLILEICNPQINFEEKPLSK